MDEKTRGVDPVRPVARPTVPRQLNFARAGGLLLGIEVLGAVIGFAATVYFAAALGATRLGVFFLFEAALATLATFSDFGLRGAVEKRISEGSEVGEMLAATLLLKLALLGVLAVVVIVFREPINDYVGAEVAALLVVAALLYELSVLSIHVLRGELRTEQTALLYFVRLVAYVAVSVVLIQFGYGAEALIYGLIASYLLMLAGGAARISTRLARPSRRHFRSLVDYAKYNGIWALGGHVYNTMDLLVIGYFLTQAHVAGYEIAWRLTLMAGLVGGIVGNTVFAQLSAWRTRGEFGRIEGTVRESLTASLFLVVPAFFGVLLLSENLLGVVFGPEYVLAAGALVVLMGEKIVAAVNVVFDATIRAFDRPDIGAYATGVSLTVNIVLNVVLVPQYGLLGAAAATGLAMALNTAVLGVSLGRLHPVSFALRDIGWCVGAGAVMALALAGLTTIVPPTTAPALVGHVLLGGVVYFLVVLSSSSLRGKLRANVANFAG
ncbi:lipopolysaccharide biosynthesis protein [Natronomonas gomsonensis]|uniref:lipopolysaccharide biosynthesis protein n=1 Tax=Natronomonas gomsonensis TaxID=1046043 RepID=UPI001C4BD37D|nr:lipopolysaccharide biosynthesis protein [Natronomonas gomsonensis]